LSDAKKFIYEGPREHASELTRDGKRGASGGAEDDQSLSGIRDREPRRSFEVLKGWMLEPGFRTTGPTEVSEE
jgi:hypothetical protein